MRGYNVMRGYFENPEATAEAIDADGWLHTGDIGTMDDRGYIKITDRLKDMFIVGGFNAYPAEIENTLLGHPQIAQAAVVGAPDERLGEVGVAFVVPRPRSGADADELHRVEPRPHGELQSAAARVRRRRVAAERQRQSPEVRASPCRDEYGGR